jgi:hypothetical protein
MKEERRIGEQYIVGLCINSLHYAILHYSLSVFSDGCIRRTILI